MNNLKIRQAIEYGVNKLAVEKVVGGPILAKIINTAIPPGRGLQELRPGTPATATKAILPSAWVGAMILPWITLAIVQAAVYTRLSRGSLLDTLGEDFIRTARAKGLTERRVLYRHAIRAAMTPVVSQLGVDVGSLLGGVVVVETVFGMQGIGQTTVQAITQGDGQLVLGFVILATIFVVVANLVVDMLYASLDPRVRLI
jgi:peptide/nickel transport system permease protein